MFRLVKISLVLVVVLSVALVASMGLTVLTYVRLTAETPIASLYFVPVSEDVFTAHLVSDDDGVGGTYEIYGDQWRIDAEFLKLKPWANILGMDARYKLVRFEGRYGDIEKENTRPHLAYELGQGDVRDIANYLSDWNFFVDAEYGSSTFTDIAPDVIYTVYRGQAGILVRSEPMPKPIGYEPSVLDDIRAWVSGN